MADWHSVVCSPDNGPEESMDPARKKMESDTLPLMILT